MKIDISRYGLSQNRGKQALPVIGAVIVILLAIIIIIWGSISLEKSIRPDISPVSEVSSTWTASLPSYWGGIIGGMISGMIALCGTFLVIRYYRKSDAHNKTIENCPFLKLEKESCANFPFSDQKIVFSLGKGESKLYVKFSIYNIGKGFAQTLVYHNRTNFGGHKFTHTFEPGKLVDKKYVIEVLYTDTIDYQFAITFLDCFGNEYIQEYVIEENTDASQPDILKNIEIVSHYPILTLQQLK